MENRSKHILVLIKFHPERELRLLQEFCKDGYTYDVVAPSFRIAADWDWMVRNERMQPAQKVLILPGLVQQLKQSGNIGKQDPDISSEIYEKAIIVDKEMSKWRSQSKVNFFLNCYLHIINSHLSLEDYSSIIGEISSAFEFLLFQKAKSIGVPYAYFIASPVTPNTFFFIDDRYQIKKLPEFYNSERAKSKKLLNGKSEAEVNIQTPGYMQFSSQMSINSLLRSNRLVQSRMNRLWNIVKTYRRDAIYSADFVPGISFYIKRWWRWSRFLILKILGNSLWTKEVQKDQYILFLQYEPEITTSLYAYPYKSQKEWIEAVLQHIEPGRILYIKEHPAMFSQRDLSFYLFLKKQKQVCLVNPAVPGKLLMQHARAVLTLNSTVGIESVKCGTPVISFGSAYFNFLPQVLKWEELKNNPSWKYLGDLGFPSKEELQYNYQLLEQSIKKIEYGGCLNDHRLDAYVMTSENMSRVKKAIEMYVGQD